MEGASGWSMESLQSRREGPGAKQRHWEATERICWYSGGTQVLTEVTGMLDTTISFPGPSHLLPSACPVHTPVTMRSLSSAPLHPGGKQRPMAWGRREGAESGNGGPAQGQLQLTRPPSLPPLPSSCRELPLANLGEQSLLSQANTKQIIHIVQHHTSPFFLLHTTHKRWLHLYNLSRFVSP